MKKILIAVLSLLLLGGLGYALFQKNTHPAQKTAPSSEIQQVIQQNADTGEGAQKPLKTDNSIYEPTVVSTGQANSGKNPEPSAPTSTSAPKTEAETKPALPPVEYVEIIHNSFAPASITVKLGTVVKWTNDDAAPHAVIADKGPFQSPTLKQTDGFTFTFSQLGEFPYHCGINPSMKGTVIVTP